MNRNLLWSMVIFLLLPLVLSVQPISQAADGPQSWRDLVDFESEHDKNNDRDRDRNNDRFSNEANPFDSNIIACNVPRRLNPGESYKISLTIVNVGEKPWIKGLHQLAGTGDVHLFGPTRLNFTRDKIAPGERVVFSYMIKAPQTPGIYTLNWQLIQGKSGWFGDKMIKEIRVRKSRYIDNQDLKDEDDDDNRVDRGHRDHNADQDRADNRGGKHDDNDRDRDRGRDGDDNKDNHKGSSGWVKLPGGGLTLSGPATCVFGKRLYMMVRGTDNGIYINSLLNGNWSGWSNVTGATPSQGTLATFDGSLYALYRGMHNAIYINRNRGNGFEGESKISGGGLTVAGPAAVSLNDQLYVTVRGTDNAVYINSMNTSGAWSGWASLGGVIASDPAITVYEGKLFIFARGTNDGIWMKDFNGKVWSGWTEIPGGGRTSAGPSVCTYRERLYVVVQGLSGSIWSNFFSGDHWSSWSQIPGDFKTSSSPSISTYQENLFLFARGTDNAIYQNRL
jgi:hypothetical protein